MKMHLVSHGRIPWKSFAGLADGMECFWADYDGVHLAEPVPAEAPPTTHVWAWADGRALRARVDIDEVIAAELTTDETTGDVVEVEQRHFDSWADHDRVGFRPSSTDSAQIARLCLVVEQGPTSLVFLMLGERSVVATA